MCSYPTQLKKMVRRLFTMNGETTKPNFFSWSPCAQNSCITNEAHFSHTLQDRVEFEISAILRNPFKSKIESSFF